MCAASPLRCATTRPLRVEEPAALARRGRVESLRHHRRDGEVGDSRRRFPRALEEDRLLAELAAGDAQRREDARQRNRRGALDIVVERRDPVPVFLQQPEGILAGEVLELDDDAGKELLRGRDEFIDQRVIFVAAQARLGQAQVERVREEGRIVGANVEEHRQAGTGRDSRARGVERELADGDSHPARALIPEAQDSLAVGDDDDRHVAPWPVAQDLRDAAAVVGADEDAARALKDVPELLARETDRRRVDDRGHLVRIVHQDPEEQRLVAIVQRSQVDVLVEIRGLAAEILENAHDLLFLREDARRKEAAETERVALDFAESGALVAQWIVQQRDSLGCRRRCPGLGGRSKFVHGGPFEAGAAKRPCGACKPSRSPA